LDDRCKPLSGAVQQGHTWPSTEVPKRVQPLRGPDTIENLLILGARRDFAALEARRLRAATLLQHGMTEAEVARRFGVHRQWVNRWAR
jgi:hypothetical protein